MPGPQRQIAILLMAMGGPERLEDVEPYLKDVRGGRPTPPELVEEVRERYRRTGGRSPVLEITRNVAGRLEQKLNGPGGERYRCYVGLRHWRPYIKDAYAELLDDLPERIIGLCMAPQYSALSTGAYMKKVEEARAALGDETPLNFVASWHRHPPLIQAMLDNIKTGLQLFPADVQPRVPILFTAHSLPSRILDMNDPYPQEVQGTVDALRERLGARPTRFAYQSQGRSQEPWLGPSVEQAADELAEEGYREVLVAPIGFLCDHIETLFDLDIELKESAARKGLRLERMPMLNDSVPLIDVLASVVDLHEASLVH
jgi:ferrochelatase